MASQFRRTLYWTTYNYDGLGRTARQYGAVEQHDGGGECTGIGYERDVWTAGELLSLAGMVNQTGTYNNRLQLTRLTAPNWTYFGNQSVDTTYTYSARRTTDGSYSTRNISGEAVTYSVRHAEPADLSR